MLRQNVGIQRSCIIDNLDLEIAHTVTGIERTDHSKNRVQDNVATNEYWKIDLEFSSRRPEIEPAILRQCRRQRISIAVVETKSVTMQGVGNCKSIVSQFGEVRLHLPERSLIHADRLMHRQDRASASILFHSPAM